MAYKAKFRPMERLGRDGWKRFEPGKNVSVTGMQEAGLRKV
jgi:arginine-tRNA-protein transferase